MQVQAFLLLPAVAIVFLSMAWHPLPERIPVGPAAAGGFDPALHELAFVTLLFLGMAGWGRRHRRPGAGPLTRLLEGLVVGCLGTSLVILVMGLTGLLQPLPLGI